MPSLLSRRKLKNDKQKHPFIKWLGRFLMGLGVMMLLSITLSAVTLFGIMGGSGKKVAPLPDKFALYHEMKGDLVEQPPIRTLLADVLDVPVPTTFMNFSDALRHAYDDDRVTHFVMRVHDGAYSLTQLQSMRRMITDFREKSGKKAIIITDNFGNMSNGMGEYWLASAFDEIWLEPLGIASLTGMHIEQPFFKEMFGNIGVEFQMERRKEYKTGAEPYTRNAMSPEGADALNDIIETVQATIISDISSARGIDEARLRSYMDSSPLLAEEALRLNLIDRVAHSFELSDYLENIFDYKNDDLSFIPIQRYAYDYIKSRGEKPNHDGSVAVVPIDGMILDDPVVANGQGIGAFIAPGAIAEARTIRTHILSLADNDNVKVIILRVNSPGGSPSASELIRGAVTEAKRKGKYIIVSMGDTAASGGYWLTVDADQIIASPLTLTGSIGVYGGKPNLEGLWDKIGLNWTSFEYGQNASMWSVNKPYSASERKRLNIMMDNIYNGFVTRVAHGRNMDVKDVEAIAKGRAWIGTDALENGLVDQLGDFETALKVAAPKVGKTPEEWRDVPVFFSQDREDPIDELKSLLGIPTGITIPDIPYSMLKAVYPEAIVMDVNVRFNL